MSEIKGRIHSFQSLGAVDGPGIRYVIFMQGCPYRCPYCHNPDTRVFDAGIQMTAAEITEKVKRYRPYFGNLGGVTVSGGEPLMQCEFVSELFKMLHENGINTAIDTAGRKPDDKVLEVIQHTDTVLCDIKFPDEKMYAEMVGERLEDVKEFLSLCEKSGKQIIIRHVVVPGLTDSDESVRKVVRIAKSVCNPVKIELLPFRKLCVEKYRKCGLAFPLENTPECGEDVIKNLGLSVKDELEKL